MNLVYIVDAAWRFLNRGRLPKNYEQPSNPLAASYSTGALFVSFDRLSDTPLQVYRLTAAMPFTDVLSFAVYYGLEGSAVEFC